MDTEDRRDFDIIGFLMTGDKIREDFWESKEFYVEELGRGICPYKDLNMLIESEFIVKINPRELSDEEVEKLPEKWKSHIRWHLKEEFAEGQVEMEREIEEREKEIKVEEKTKPQEILEIAKEINKDQPTEYRDTDSITTDNEEKHQKIEKEFEFDEEGKYNGAKVTPFNPNFESESYNRDEDLMHKEAPSQTPPNDSEEIDEEKVKEDVEKTKQASVEISMVEESDPKDILREKIETLNHELEGLGFTDRKRKKEIKKEIEELEKQL